MTLLQLLYFETLARMLHYTHAAQELHISQPSLSYAMNELEKELGVKLFLREKRRIALTPYGQRFLPYVQKALSCLDQGKLSLQTMKGEEKNILHLGYFHSISSSFVPPLIESFYQAPEHRRIHFQFMEGTSYEIYSQVKEGKLDLGFSTHHGPDIQTCLVMKQPLYLVVPLEHPLAKKNSVTFNDFAKEPIIGLTRGSNLRDQLDRTFLSHHIAPNLVFEVQECNAALQYIDLKFGVGILPEIPTLHTARVVALPIAEKEATFIRNVFLIWDPDRPMSPAVEAVRDFIVDHYSLKGQEDSLPVPTPDGRRNKPGGTAPQHKEG